MSKKIFYILLVFVTGWSVKGQIPVPSKSEAEEVSAEKLTKKILENVDVGKIEKKDLAVGYLIDLISKKTKDVGHPIDFDIEKKIRERRIILRVNKVSAFTLLLIIKDNISYGDFKIVGNKVVFPKVDI